MSTLHTPARPHAALPPVDLAPSTEVPNAARAAASARGHSEELSDDDLEAVVGGLARTWTEALRATAHHQA